MRHRSAVLVLLAAALPAQDAFQARKFLPVDYHNVVHVDLARLRATGIWDELEVGMLKVVLGQMEKEAGFALEHLDRLTMVPQGSKPDPDGDGGPRNHHVLVFEGNSELAVPDRVARSSSYAAETIGDQEVMRRDRWFDEVFFRPRPEVQVYGSTELLRPMLEGRVGPGVPCADIMSLMAGREDALLHFVAHLADEQLNDRVLKDLFPDAEWPEGDRPQYLMMHLSAVGDPDDPHVEFEAVLRHVKAGDGMAVTSAAVDALLERVAKEPQLRLVAPLLKNVERSRDRTDLTLRLDLGRARTAAGRIAMFVMPLMMMGRAVETVEAVEILEEDVAEPPPPPPPEKKGAGKRGGGNDG